VALYHGDLLEDWFQDWCLYERERLQNIYLAALDKLMDYCEASRDYDAGLAYGTRILRHDLARERTHRRLMRLYYLAGDRTSALRQYDRCVQILCSLQRRVFGVCSRHKNCYSYYVLKNKDLAVFL
jgi:two-component SAPR family response regulator